MQSSLYKSNFITSFIAFNKPKYQHLLRCELIDWRYITGNFPY